MAVGRHVSRRSHRRRPAEEEALSLWATVREKPVRLRSSFDTLGNDVDAEAHTEVNQAVDQFLCDRPKGEIGHEGLIDLEGTDG